MAPVTHFGSEATLYPKEAQLKVCVLLIVVEPALQPGDFGGGHVAEWNSENVAKAGLDDDTGKWQRAGNYLSICQTTSLAESETLKIAGQEE